MKSHKIFTERLREEQQREWDWEVFKRDVWPVPGHSGVATGLLSTNKSGLQRWKILEGVAQKFAKSRRRSQQETNFLRGKNREANLGGKGESPSQRAWARQSVTGAILKVPLCWRRRAPTHNRCLIMFQLSLYNLAVGGYTTSKRDLTERRATHVPSQS